jgi:hAT family C-terminal dimerisation region
MLFDYTKIYYTIGIVRTPICTFWRDHQHLFPALANLARDILSIPATGAGVERLFNSARDICHYRRGSLKPSTIQDLMMFMCTSRFEIEDSHRALINEYLSSEERQASQEEKDISIQQFEPISDNEEEDDGGHHSGGEGEGDGDGAQPLQSQRTLIEDEASGEPSLPSTQRHLGRVRQRSILLKGYKTKG